MLSPNIYLRYSLAAAIAISVTFPLGTLAESAQAQMSEQTAMQKSQAAIKEYATTLKAALQTAMKAGGPMAAIPVCHTQAPQIAAQVGKKYDLEIHRTSLKPRAIAPQPWEKTVLEQFEVEKDAGKPIGKIVWHKTVDENGQKELRLMKAIPTGEVCLTCHGTNVAPAVLSKIKSLYPNDEATGYKLGDIRGAFSVTAALN
ncbi:MAG: hypothetical protein B7X44_09805 [Halothiobacillus sp. 15-55-196]|jgi:FtsP/CotA-like multicopper oxidase with cupredoxin domain|nr:MAG: hypothetical protein B7X44_09805 [Halothiobacillus sp. 15-55-196]